MKRIFALTFLFFLIPVASAWAQPGGYFHGKAVPTSDGSTTTAVTDGNRASAINIRYGPNPVYKFSEPVNIRKIYIDAQNLLSGQLSFQVTTAMGTKTTISPFGSFVNASWNDYMLDKVIEVKVQPTQVTNINLYELDFITDTMLEYNAPVASLAVKEKNHNSITLKWLNPEGAKGVRISQGGKPIEDLPVRTDEYKVTGLLPLTEYSFNVQALYDNGIVSPSNTIAVKTADVPPPPPDRDGDGIPDDEDEYPDDPTNTPPPPPDRDGDGIPDDEDEYPDDPENLPPGPREVKDLKVKSTDERVDLTWKNPRLYFEKAKIYRMELGGATAINLNPFAARSVSAATYKPLFETNGTEFSDLSIESEKEYQYKVTTVYKGEESQGVVVRTTIPKPPLVDFRGSELPFDVIDLIKSGNGLVWLISAFVLIGLAFLFVPKLIRLIRGSNKSSTQHGAIGTTRTAAIATEQKPRGVRTVREGREGRNPKLTTRQRKEVTGRG